MLYSGVLETPMEEELKRISCPDNFQAKIVTANLISIMTWHLGFPIHYLQAIRDITPTEQLCISYGTNYWDNLPMNKQISPALFDKAGKIIATIETDFLRRIKKIENLDIENIMDAPRNDFVPSQFQNEFPMSPNEGIAENAKQDIIDTIRSNIGHYLQCIPKELRKDIGSCINNITYDYPLDLDESSHLLNNLIYCILLVII